MKRNYQSGAQKRQAKRRKTVEAARNSQRLNSWLTRPETSKADDQDVKIRETESTPRLVDVNSFNNSYVRITSLVLELILTQYYMQNLF